MAHETNFAEPAMDEEMEGAEIRPNSLTTLMQVSEAEVNQQILTARAYPRNTTNFRQALQELTCYDQETALACLYALKREGKPIQGPSIDFAMAAFQTWGNARCGSSIIDIGEEFVTSQGFFWDLEKNTGLAIQILRRITTREGKRYGDDMIMTTGNAAGSIAVRNAILKGVPKVAWNLVYQKCRQLSIGKGESIQEKRENMVKAFAPLNVDRAQIFGLLGVKGIDDVSVEDMIFMGGILTSIKEGGQTVEQAFSPENMQNPDEVRPREPRRNDFAGKKTGGEKKAEPPKPEGEKPQSDQGKTQESQTQAATSTDERGDLVNDAHKELSACTKVKQIGELRERIVDMGFMTDAEEKSWNDACDAKAADLVEKLKQARKG